MHSSFRQLLEKLVEEKPPGPLPSFSAFHLLLALEFIAERTTGRNKLAQELGVGEGAARTLIGRLKGASLVSTSKAGCTLTDRGLKLLRDYTSAIRKVRIEKNELTFEACSFAVLVKNSGHRVKSGMEQRDTAVTAGAKSATTILFKNGRLVFPSMTRDIDEDFPNASSQIRSLLKPQENDAIIVVSSDSSVKAEYGALAAAWTLVNNEH